MTTRVASIAVAALLATGAACSRGGSTAVVDAAASASTSKAESSSGARGSSASEAERDGGKRADASRAGDAARRPRADGSPTDGSPADAADARTDSPGDAGSPVPLALAVTSADNPALALIPAFSPGTFDYYVRCEGHSDAAVLNALTLSATAPPGTTVALSLETPGGSVEPVGGGAAPVTLSTQADPGQAIVVSVTQGSATTEYWVRCIPDDFPEMQWTPHDAGARTLGYYLFGTVLLPEGSRGTLAPEAAYAVILDSNGVPVWYKPNGTSVTFDVESLEPGQISFARQWEVDVIGGSVSYPVVDGVDGGPPVAPDDHELRLLPNGHYIGLLAAPETADLTGLTLPTSTGGTIALGPDTAILGCYVQEFDADGTVFWRWSATDHFDPAKAMTFLGHGELTGPPVQPFHCNAVDVDPANGNLLVSSRDMASVFYIDRSTGRVLWKMGGAGSDSSYDDPIYVPVDDPFIAQHDARLQPGWDETCAGGSGQISLFDDETNMTAPARAVVYDVRIAGGCGDAGPRTAGTTGATRVWEYKSTFDGGVPSAWCGGFRISGDGSRVVGWGQSQPRPNGVVFSEVNEAGDDLLDLICPDDSASYRAIKAPLSQFDLGALRIAAGL